MFKSLILTGLLSSGIGAFATTPLDNQPLYTPQEQAVNYVDDDDYIILSANEVNNYHFDNLFTTLDELTDGVYEDIETYILSLSYNSETFYYNGSSDGALIWDSAELHIIDFIYAHDTYLSANELNVPDYTFVLNRDDNLFSSDLTINFTTDYYNDFKNAIELDIQANTAPRHQAGLIAALMSFITLLTSGIVQLATGIAGGIAHMAKALFLNAAGTHLSIFGGLIAIFAGIALAVALTTKVYTWITSLGN